MLIAAKPTPSVMPTKYLPSRVNFSPGGGAERGRPECGAHRLVAGERTSAVGIGKPIGGAERRSARGRARAKRQAHQSGTGTRATMSRTAASASSRLGHVALRVRREADAVREHRHREVVDVVRDAVGAAAEQGAGARGAREVHGRRGSTRRARGAGELRVAEDQRLQVVAERVVERSPGRTVALQRHELSPGRASRGTAPTVSVLPSRSRRSLHVAAAGSRCRMRTMKRSSCALRAAGTCRRSPAGSAWR